MVPINDEVSQTIPRRGSTREAQRIGVLLLAGTPGNPETLRAARVVQLADGLEIGRRPPTPDGRRALALPDRTVSSLHARITRSVAADKSDTFELVDLGSTNGTYVDGQRLTGPITLRPGALIFVGSQAMVFRLVTPLEMAAIDEDIATPFAPVPTLSPALASICSRLRRLAPSRAEIYLLGETGVGKEVFARGIHAASGRTGNLVAINCAAIPRELVESELFGYEKGAHSTAQARKVGFIEAAQGGTLFLDELGEMPAELQPKLLRFLQDRKFSPLGSTRVIEADVRVIAASSRAAMAKAGNVQDALVGRLGAQPVQLPALRDRLEDVGRLVEFFLRDMRAGETGAPRTFETEAFHALFLYGWPLNVRELQKTVVEAEVLSRGHEIIGFSHLPDSISALIEPAGDGAHSSVLSATRDSPKYADSGIPDPADEATTARTRRPAPTPEELTALLRQYRGSVAHVARHLDRQYAVVWRCIQRYGIDADDFRSPSGENS
ncbi:MAG TPA: sigma 54-interacting transcriptional regulator [Polyangia bacterium]|jgi:DNA-binding NtrC family response regulator|nr:sigma 54-interacting transcriptional regulator [Polyangia bacterium]